MCSLYVVVVLCKRFLWDRMWRFEEGFIAVVHECDQFFSDEEHFRKSLVQLL